MDGDKNQIITTRLPGKYCVNCMLPHLKSTVRNACVLCVPLHQIGRGNNSLKIHENSKVPRKLFIFRIEITACNWIWCSIKIGIFVGHHVRLTASTKFSSIWPQSQSVWAKEGRCGRKRRDALKSISNIPWASVYETKQEDRGSVGVLSQEIAMWLFNTAHFVVPHSTHHWFFTSRLFYFHFFLCFICVFAFIVIYACHRRFSRLLYIFLV